MVCWGGVVHDIQRNSLCTSFFSLEHPRHLLLVPPLDLPLALPLVLPLALALVRAVHHHPEHPQN